MKPAPFEYFRPACIRDASSALKEANGEAKLIAGGQSIGPMLNLRLVQPRLLVDISGIEELSGFEQDCEILKIGACITAAAPARQTSVEIQAEVLRGLQRQPLAGTVVPRDLLDPQVEGHVHEVDEAAHHLLFPK